MDIAALIDRYDAAWNGQDLDAIASMHDDDIVFHNHTAGEMVEGDHVRDHLAAIFANWPDLRFTGRRRYVAPGFAVSTLACVSAAPRGTTSTAAVEMTANASSGDTSAGGGGAPLR